MKPIIWTACLALGLALPALAAEKIIKDEQGMDCYVYTPDDLDPSKTYQLIVGVHGAGGKGNGAAGMKGWADRGDVIVIGPSFQTKGDRPYQNGDGPHAAKLIKLIDGLKKDYKLEEKIFMHGFSGGSQFAHRFVMLHPDLVCGVSSHSGGSWATDTYGTINKKAKKIPFAISCGEKDTGKAWGDAPFNRLEWFKRFKEEIDKDGFCYAGTTWPDVAHRQSPGMWDLVRECFQLSTGLPGKSATEKVEISDLWKNLDGAEVIKAEDVRPSGVPYVAPAELDKMTKAAFAKANREEIPNDKLVSFMERYPPVLWKEKPGNDKLLGQCKRAAMDWRERATKAGKFSGAVQSRFEKFSNGLDLEAP